MSLVRNVNRCEGVSCTTVRFFFVFFPVLGWELLHGTLPRLKGRLWPAWSDHLSRSTHSHNDDVALTPTGFSKIWQSLQFLLLSSQMESGLAWNHLLFYCTVQNSNNFDGQITLFESGRVCRMWHLYDRHTHTHTDSHTSNRFNIYFPEVLSHFQWAHT